MEFLILTGLSGAGKSKAVEMLEDIDRNTVNFSDNFDGSLQEPDVLPAKLPNLLLNGTSGIAVGMATNIPPHNLREVAAAITFMIEHMIESEGDPDEAVSDISVDDLMQFVKGPDFPTGAMIVGGAEIKEVYATGKGRIVMRAKTEIQEMHGERFRIVVTEIPYQVNKSSILERIAELVRDGRLEMIANLRDESDRRGMAIAIELKRGAQPRTILNRLLKYTQLQSTFGVQMLALVDGEPREAVLLRESQRMNRLDAASTRRERELCDAAVAETDIADLSLSIRPWWASLEDPILRLRADPASV